MHPAQVESVAWATEQKNLLSMAFALLASIYWLRFRESQAKRHLLLATAALLAGLLSKTVVCTLPVVVVILDRWQAGKFDRKTILHMGGWLVIASGIAAITVWREHITPWPRLQEFDWNIWERLLIAGRALIFYLTQLIWPFGLAPVYPHWPVNARLVGYVIVALALPAFLWKFRDRLSVDPLAAVLIYYVLLLPSLGIVRFNYQKASFVADHLQYHATGAGLSFLAACAVLVTQRLPVGARLASATLLLTFLVGISWNASRYYATPETFWRHAVQRNPDSCVTNFQLANVLAEQGRIAESIEYYSRAVHRCPHAAIIHCNFGQVLTEAGQFRAADEHLRLALELDPNSALPANAMGNLLLRQGSPGEALTYFRRALEVLPDLPDLHYNIALAYIQTDNLEQAKEHLEAAIGLAPGFTKALVELGVLHARVNEPVKATELLKRAVASNPQSVLAHWRLAEYLVDQDWSEARESFDRAMALEPQNPQIPYTLGQACLTLRHSVDAIQHFSNAYQINNFPPAGKALAWVLATIPDPAHRDGTQALELIRQICPDDLEVFDCLNIEAAALAELGRFEEAVQAMQRAIANLPSDFPEGLRKTWNQRLEMYRNHQPYRLTDASVDIKKSSADR